MKSIQEQDRKKLRSRDPIQDGGVSGSPFSLVDRFTFVSLVDGDLLGSVLDLQKQFHTFDGSHGCFRNGCRHTTGDEILGEGKRIFAHVEWIEDANCVSRNGEDECTVGDVEHERDE